MNIVASMQQTRLLSISGGAARSILSPAHSHYCGFIQLSGPAGPIGQVIFDLYLGARAEPPVVQSRENGNLSSSKHGRLGQFLCNEGQEKEEREREKVRENEQHVHGQDSRGISQRYSVNFTAIKTLLTQATEAPPEKEVKIDAPIGTGPSSQVSAPLCGSKLY